MSRIAIIAAMPGELKPLVKDWKSVRTGQRFAYKWTAKLGENECVAVCAGMGTEAPILKAPRAVLVCEHYQTRAQAVFSAVVGF